MTGQGDVLVQSIGGGVAMAAMLRRVLADRDLSHEQIALRIERPTSFVIDVENVKGVKPSLLTAALLARACEVSVSLFVASFAIPAGDPLPWPREHRPAGRTPVDGAIPGARPFGAMLRELRSTKNWSQRELGRRAGISASHIGSMERGATVSPSLLTLTRLGRAFASATPGQIAYITQLAQSYAGEIPAPSVRSLAPDRLAPPSRPD